MPKGTDMYYTTTCTTQRTALSFAGTVYLCVFM